MIKVGIAGFGKIGQLRADILSKRDDVIIVGVYDVVKPVDGIKYDFFNSYLWIKGYFFVCIDLDSK